LDTSEKYIRMCERAKKVQEEWMKMPKEKRYGTLIRCRTFLGIVVPTNKLLKFDGLATIIPETLPLRTWLKERETLIITTTGLKYYSDEGTPLFRQDQLQELVNKVKPADWYEHIDWMCLDEVDDWEEFETGEQLWLAYVMKHRYGKIWDNKKEEWVRWR